MTQNPVYLVSFIEIVNRSSMVEAAKHLHITPAAISKHVQALERAMGLKLLNRSTRHVEPTAAGYVYFEHAKRILEAYRDAEAALSHSKIEPSGMLKVICGPQFGYQHFLPNMKEFLMKYPKVRLHVEFTQTMPNLEKEKVDVIMGLTNNIPTHYIQRTLTQTRWVLCASEKYLKKEGIPQKPSDLIHHKIITHTKREPNNILTFKTGEKIHFEPVLYLNDTRAMRRSALHDVGIVQLHEYIVEQDLKEKKLIEILRKNVEQKKTIRLYIAYLPSSHVHIKIRKFVDFMLEIVNSDKTFFCDL